MPSGIWKGRPDLPGPGALGTGERPGMMRDKAKDKMFPFGFGKKRTEKLQRTFSPRVRGKPFPGQRSVKLTESLKRYECPGITFTGEAGTIFFNKGLAANLIDVDGNRYLDFTASFAVANLGYDSPAVKQAIAEQTKRMIHGMGDVYPNDVKVELAKRLSEITPGNLNQTIFSSTGSEAVESALKTAVMATKKPGVVAFTGAYHGLGYGALAVTDGDHFRKPFLKHLGAFCYRAPFPDVRIYEGKASQTSLKAVQKIIKTAKKSRHAVGAVILEPILGRGGIVPAPPEFLKGLRALCDQERVLMIADEIFTGFGRTGSLFAMERSGVTPDLLCLGKALGNGFPISACIGPARLMMAWGRSTGEAVHTSTFLGNPLGCAVALAVIDQIQHLKLPERAKTLGDFFRKEMWKLKEKYPVIADIRGSGLMIGVELSQPQVFSAKKTKAVPATEKAKQLVSELMKKGIVLMTAGPAQNVLAFTPPLIISEKEIMLVIRALDEFFKKNP